MKRSIFFIVLFPLLFPACKTNPESRPAYTFLIPAAHEGPLILIYNETCGILPRVENGKATYRFGEKGFLILQKEESPNASYEFYLVDSLGRQTPVPQIQTLSDRISGAPVILGSGLTVSSQNVKQVNIETIKEEGGAVCTWYWLYNKNRAPVHYLEDPQTVKQLDSVTNRLVQDCRNTL